MLAFVGDAHRRHAASPESEGSSAASSTTFEVPERGNRILAGLERAGWEIRSGADFGMSPIERVHRPRLIDHLRREGAVDRQPDGPQLPEVFPHVGMVPTPSRDRLADPEIGTRGAEGSLCFDRSSPLYPGSWEAIYEAAQLALSATHARSQTTWAYALCRPPGHHAAPDLYGGFCYLNNAAIAAAELRANGDRVAILDLDIHHGNGTQAIWWEEPTVLTVSIHEHPSFGYPYFTGYRDEVGEGEGSGFNLNLPVSRQCSSAEYRETLDEAVEAIREYAPSTLVVALGFDALAADPLSDAQLSSEDFGAIAARLKELGIPGVVTQEGGYALEHLAAAAEAFFGELIG